MNRTGTRARVVIGAAIVAAASFSATGSIAATTEPPSSDPTSSAPASSEPEVSVPDGSAPALDPEREALLEQIMSVTEAEDFPLNRDCLAGIVAQLSDADVPLVSAEVAGPAETAIDVTLPDIDAAPATTLDADDMVSESSVPIDSTPEMSPEAEALGDQIIYCLEGDADPDLVEEAIGVIEADESAPVLDMRCVASALTTFDNESLQLIIDNGFESVSDAGTPDASMPDDDTMEDAFLLLACMDGLTDETAAAATEAAPAGTDSVATDTTEA